MLRLLCYCDVHIFDESSCRRAAQSLKKTAAIHKPDVIIGLGDLFDSIAHCREFGPDFRDAMRAFHDRCLFVYGNHDGGNVKGGGAGGWEAFNEIFGHAQRVEEVGGRRLIMLADQQRDSGWESFAVDQIARESILLSHSPFQQSELDKFAAKGASLALNGHAHVSRRLQSRDGTCQQITLSPMPFAGMLQEPAGCALIDLSEEGIDFRWNAIALPRMPGNNLVFDDGVWPAAIEVEGHFPGEPNKPRHMPPLVDGNREWLGGAQRLQLRVDGVLKWDRSYGRSFVDNCESKLVRHGGREYLLVSGTWVRRAPGGVFESLVVVDPDTGEERYRVEVIGLSQPPTVVDGVIYIVGQWREAIAIELATGHELWRHRSQVETEETKGLSWYDGRLGGGWSICPAAVGKHVWTVNARGDLFGYDKASGEERFVHPAAIPLNKEPRCPYAVTLACAPHGHTSELDEQGHRLFGFNGVKVNDETGHLVNAT